jgi:hypothetical protein
MTDHTERTPLYFVEYYGLNSGGVEWDEYPTLEAAQAQADRLNYSENWAAEVVVLPSRAALRDRIKKAWGADSVRQQIAEKQCKRYGV